MNPSALLLLLVATAVASLSNVDPFRDAHGVVTTKRAIASEVLDEVDVPLTRAGSWVVV